MGSGGRPILLLKAMNKPFTNADSFADIHFGPESPGAGKNWLRTLPGKGYFVILRLSVWVDQALF